MENENKPKDGFLQNTPLWRVVNGAFKMALPMTLNSIKALFKEELVDDIQKLNKNYRLKNIAKAWNVWDRAIEVWCKEYLHSFQDSKITPEEFYQSMLKNKERHISQLNDMKCIGTTVAIGDPAYLALSDIFFIMLKEEAAADVIEDVKKQGYTDIGNFRFYMQVLKQDEIRDINYISKEEKNEIRKEGKKQNK